jgi:hypothetical protein
VCVRDFGGRSRRKEGSQVEYFNSRFSSANTTLAIVYLSSRFACPALGTGWLGLGDDGIRGSETGTVFLS